jgi:UDP-N-acetylmuramoyl-L-alanyl-D-glutamate--2,6-diaminopimelate ligase
LEANAPEKIGFSARELGALASDDRSVRFDYAGQHFSLPIAGTFNALNALAAIKMARAFGVEEKVSARALENLPVVRGRVERVECGQGFLAIVDYAHTPDSLKALYGAYPNRRKICVLGNTGGGRDTWKRPEMAHIAEESCDVVILTNEDPYDEPPEKIVQEMAAGMKEKRPEIIMDRRAAIRAALRAARTGDAVLISGKGTDPYIMEAKGKKIPWSDAAVVREELEKLLKEPGTM